MKKSHLTAAIFAALLLLNPISAHAKALEGRLSLGYSDTSGNTDEEKINFDFNLKDKRTDKFNLLYDGLVNYGKASGLVNSDKKRAHVLGEFVQDEKNSFYVESGVLKDRFAGFETRLNFGAGFFKVLVAEEDTNLKAAAGLQITKEDYTDTTSKTQQWVKLGLKGDKVVGENIKLLSSIDLGAPKDNFQDRYEVDFMIGTLFAVNSQFDFETKFITNYRNTPLVSGKEKRDSTFITNLVYKM